MEDDVSDHFSYLTETDFEFFQKTACEKVDEERGLKKVARATFDVRVERDLHIIKTAGVCGLSFGAVERADAYIDRLLRTPDDLPEHFPETFDKIAATAIEADLGAAREQLYKLADEDLQPMADADLALIGLDLVDAYQMEKEALLGIMRAGRAARKGFAATKGLGVGARLRSVASAPRRAFESWKTERGVAKVRKAQQKAGVAATRLQKAQAIADPAVRAQAVSGAQKTLKGRQATLQSQRQALKEHQVGMHRSRQKTLGTKPAPTSMAAQRPAAPVPKPEKPAVVKDKKKKKGADEPANSSAAGAADDAAEGGWGSDVMDAISAARNRGIGALTPAQRSRLLEAGAATLVGGRLVLGQGLVTGGEGLV